MKKLNFQLFSGDRGTVYPVHNNVFKIGDASSSATIIRGLENFSPAIDGQVESWFEMTEGGWQSNAVTGKALSIDFSGKRRVGDVGNDYIFGKMLATGVDAEAYFEWEFPSGAILTGDVVINVTTPGGGDTTNVDALEFSVMFNGKPSYLPAGPVPTGLAGVAPTTSGGVDGSITGTTTSMEYKAESGSTYTVCTASSTTVGGAGKYLVRTKATSSAAASKPATVTVPAYSG